VSAIDFGMLRQSMGQMATDHDAVGEQKPSVGEVFTPAQHASALAPSTLVVVGARGAGKSFWAGVLGQDDTRLLASRVYRRLGLENVTVRFGYNGFEAPPAVGSRTIAARVAADDTEQAVFFWRVVILRCASDALGHPDKDKQISALMTLYADPEDLELRFRSLDEELKQKGKTALILFDALDTLSKQWRRLTMLTDALFEAVWLLRSRANIRAKLFIRPDQLNDDGLTFVEMPKIRSARVELNWNRRDLYGLLYTRLVEAEQVMGDTSFRLLAEVEGAPAPEDDATRLISWPLVRSEERQKKVMERLAGLYMGRGANKGATYPWTFNHLADGRGLVTPRSFLKLFVEAANHPQPSSSNQALTPESIRHGLREASKTRVEQLSLEYRWVKRALAPLAGLKVPCARSEIHDLWRASNTVEVITKAAESEQFLPPYDSTVSSIPEEALEAAMERIGVISYRPDGRADIPDLFRIAARMFKLGGVALRGKS
jgi:hypothetical protein